MLQNSKFTDFTASALLRENQQGREVKISPTQIRVKERSGTCFWCAHFQQSTLKIALRYRLGFNASPYLHIEILNNLCFEIPV